MSSGHRLLVAVVLVAASVGTARAQAPGQTPPGSDPMNGAPQHAVAPLPQAYPSPMPTLPPPSRRSGGESGGIVRFRHGGFSEVLHPDGSIDFEDHTFGGGAGINMLLGPIAFITFDVTDGVMRSLGQDPYLAEKLRIMDSTREMRMAVRRRHDAVVMRNALDDLPNYLGAVWRYRGWTPEIRRQILFALWDEAAEDGNELLRAGGAEARATIERFIAVHLPPGSPDAFGADELVALNRMRTSRATFTPYPAVEPSPAEPTIAAVADADASPREAVLAVALRAL